MRVIDAAAVESALDYTALVEALRQAFRSDITTPLRHHHTIPVPGGQDGTLLLMPAWQDGTHIGIKIASAFPDNGASNLPMIMATYLLLNGRTGEPLAMIDGVALTVRRTACASALAASYLAREDSERLLMVGTGQLAPHLIKAHAAIRPIREVLIWGRSPAKARSLASTLNSPDLKVDWTEDLASAAAGADIISCATGSADPLIKGAWLTAGTHVDLVGGYRPDMRETDDDAIRRSTVFVDTREGACVEAGDIVLPIENGLLRTEDTADLFDLTKGDRDGRRHADEITLFKSVGTALEDLAAAQLTMQRT
ncbi:MAG: ornithine cyclodeaminase family protein [Pseudomonadota bacterium]